MALQKAQERLNVWDVDDFFGVVYNHKEHSDYIMNILNRCNDTCGA